MDMLGWISRLKNKVWYCAACGALALASVPNGAWAQYTYAQSFDGGPNQLSYTVVNTNGGSGQAYSGLASALVGGLTATPGTTVGVGGSAAFGIINLNAVSGTAQTTQLDIPLLFQQSGGSVISFQLAAHGLGPGPGLTAQGSVVLSLSTDGGSTYQPAVTITGARGAAWDYAATGVAATTLGTPITRIVTTSSEAVSTIRVTIAQENLANVRARITLNANFLSALFIDNITVTSPRPLPVHLIRFSAERRSQQVLLTWATAMEQDNAYFEVQRSPDGKTFGAIGQVRGSGTTAKGAIYSFTDLSPLAAPAYYRLRQVDHDGSGAYSLVAPVAGPPEAEVALFPNPSTGTIALPYARGPVKYRLYAATGKTLMAGMASSGATLSVQQVPAGVYFMELVIEGRRSVQRLVRK